MKVDLDELEKRIRSRSNYVRGKYVMLHLIRELRKAQAREAALQPLIEEFDSDGCDREAAAFKIAYFVSGIEI